jgi:hypothetical protein
MMLPVNIVPSDDGSRHEATKGRSIQRRQLTAACAAWWRICDLFSELTGLMQYK